MVLKFASLIRTQVLYPRNSYITVLANIFINNGGGYCDFYFWHFLLVLISLLTACFIILYGNTLTIDSDSNYTINQVFLFIINGCESWTVEKAECQKIDAFELWCWRRLLRVPWTARRSTQSILKGISPGCSLEGLMLKLKLQYFGHLMWRADSFEKTLMLEKIEGRRRRDDRGWDSWMASSTQRTWVWVSSLSWWWTGRPGVLQSMGLQRVRHDWATELNFISSVKRVSFF